MTHSILTYVVAAIMSVAPVRVAEQVRWTEDAANYSDVRSHALAALFITESNMDPDAVSPIGARGLGQLFRTNAFWAPWRRLCFRQRSECDRAGAVFAARAFKYYLTTCGSEIRAFAAYRVGHCVRPGPKSRATMDLSRRIESMVHAWKVFPTY